MTYWTIFPRKLKTMLRTAKLWRENKEYHSDFEQGLLNFLKNNTLKFMKATGRDIGSVRKNSTIGVIYNWYVLLYLNIVLKVCKNGYTCNQLQSGKLLTKSFFYGIDTGGTVRIINCPRVNCMCRTWHWIRENKSNNKDSENIAKKSCVLSNFIPWKCH